MYLCFLNSSVFYAQHIFGEWALLLLWLERWYSNFSFEENSRFVLIFSCIGCLDNRKIICILWGTVSISTKAVNFKPITVCHWFVKRSPLFALDASVDQSVSTLSQRNDPGVFHLCLGCEFKSSSCMLLLFSYVPAVGQDYGGRKLDRPWAACG